MKQVKHKTTAMVEDALKEHHRMLFWIDVKFCAGILLILAITGGLIFYA